MTGTEELISQLYAAFNARDIDAALQRMTDNVDWPKASEGGRVKGKDAIRDYWTRQWAEFNPHVEPIEVTGSGNTADVKVHQIVKDTAGQLLSDQVVVHRYTLDAGRVASMNILEGAAPAFERH